MPGYEAKDIEKILKEAAKDEGDYWSGRLGDENWDELEYKFKTTRRVEGTEPDAYGATYRYVTEDAPIIHDDLTITLADSDTGGEGHGENIYMVFKVVRPIVKLGGAVSEEVRYFEKQGYYASYDGSNWDGQFTEVYPREVKVTRWVNQKWTAGDGD